MLATNQKNPCLEVDFNAKTVRGKNTQKGCKQQNVLISVFFCSFEFSLLSFFTSSVSPKVSSPSQLVLSSTGKVKY